LIKDPDSKTATHLKRYISEKKPDSATNTALRRLKANDFRES
jgi:hypothetical protein